LGDIPRIYAARTPDLPALIYPDATLTWAQLEHRASQRARMLGARGVAKGDFVTLAVGNSALFYEATFALWKLGACPNVVSSRLPAHELKAIVELVRPKVVITEVPAPDLGRPCIAADADTTAYSAAPIDSQVHAHWKAMTSGGSTGRPKVIVDNTPAEVDLDPSQSALYQHLRIAPGMVILNPGPLHHNGPFLFTELGLFVGCKVVGMTRFDAEESLRLIEEHAVNWVTFVPTMMHRIMALPASVRDRYDLSSLRIIWHMAAACPVWLKERWIDWLGPDRIWELYGGTEGIGGTEINGREWLQKRGSVGRPTSWTTLKVAAEDGRLCAPGEIGELFFLPPDPAPSHYLGAEFRQDAEGWKSLGDLGSVDEDGYVFLADRRTDLIIRGGANIYPAEVEAALDANDQVASSVVISLPCPELGHRVHAIVQPRDGMKLDLQALRAFAGQRLARYKLPESFEFASSPLRDDAGKVRRSALRAERLAWLAEGREFRLLLD